MKNNYDPKQNSNNLQEVTFVHFYLQIKTKFRIVRQGFYRIVVYYAVFFW